MEEIWTDGNAFCSAPGQDAWIYWDAATYFKAFIETCAKASHEIFIAGWDIHSETNLAPDWEGSWIPQRWSLNQFLQNLLESKPHLHIYLLCWDYSPIYLLEREVLQSIRFGWMSHPRLHFKMDGAHPVGGSQHQKFVVVDRTIAFLGGIDLTIRRWDTCEHAAHHPLRYDPQGREYGPYHDMQLGISGSLVKNLADMFRERWLHATDEQLSDMPLDRVRAMSGSITGAYALENVSMALSRTLPAFREFKARHEIAQMYEDLFMIARRQVIVENQYFTSRHMVQVLTQVLQKKDGPEILFILPESAGGWLEQKTMGLLQGQALYEIKQADLYNRLQVFSPVNRSLMRSRRSITVHSKVMVIDGQIVSIGSANLNNRSMGLDSECNATLQLRTPAPSLVAHLLAHHTQGKTADIQPWLQGGGSLREAVQILNRVSSKRFLKDFPIREVEASLVDVEWADAEKPSVLEEGMDRWSLLMQIFARKIGLSSPVVLVGVGIVLLLGFIGIWYILAQEAPIDQKRLMNYFASHQRDIWLRHALIPLSYAVGGLLFVPINILILATAALLPPGPALAHILLGVIVNVSVCYITGHVVGRYVFRRFFGPRVRDILRRVGKGHFLTLVALRIVPIAPNSLINLTAGVGHVPFLRFLCATLVGMAPGLLLLVIFQVSLFSVLEKPEVVSVFLLIILLATAVMVAQWSMRRFSHYGRS